VAALAADLLTEIMVALAEPVFRVDRAATEDRLRTALAEGRYRALLAIGESGQAIGFLGLFEGYALYTEGPFGVIPELYVRPEQRSRGVGRRLLREARAHGEALGWSRLEVTTPPLPPFERTLAFYEREGFTVSGGRKLKVSL
jgi:GNAT superfamily N-acetyltransferase